MNTVSDQRRLCHRFPEAYAIRHEPCRRSGDHLLRYASGAELLLLMAMSNARMRRQIRCELDSRAVRPSSRASEPRIGPIMGRAA